MITIENQIVQIQNKFKGKVIANMTPQEICDMEAFLRKGMSIRNFKYVYGGDGHEIYQENANGNKVNVGAFLGGVFNMPKNEPKTEKLSKSQPTPQQSCTIRINGHEYSSWEEMLQGEQHADNIIKFQSIRADGTIVEQKMDGRVFINGRQACDPGQRPIYIVINGDVDSVTTNIGDVTVYGNIDSAKSTSGDIKASHIHSSCHTVSGDIKAAKIDGNASTVSGDIHKL